jgi:hypothetical protein
VHFSRVELHRIDGELRHRVGAPNDEVEACFTEALDVARRQEAKSFELRAAVSLAGLWRVQGKCEQARGLLGSIYG